MMTTLGVVFLLIAIGMYVVPKFMNLRTEDETRETQRGPQVVREKHPAILTEWTGIKSLALAGVGVLFMISTSAFYYATPGHQYYIVSPTGSVSCEYTQGWKLVTPFSRIMEWESYIDIKVVSGEEPTEGIEGVIRDGIGIRFIDKVVGNVKLSVRMQLPKDDESFKKLVL